MSTDPAVQAAIEARRVHEFADSGSSNCRCGWEYGDDGLTLDGHRLLVGIAAARPIIEAGALNRMADDLGKNVACPDCLRARAEAGGI